MDILEAGVLSGEDALEIAQDVQIAGILKDADVQPAVGQVRVGEEAERPAVEAAVANKNEASLDRPDFVIAADEFRRFLSGHVGGGEEVTDWAEGFFERKVGGLKDFGVQSDPG